MVKKTSNTPAATARIAAGLAEKTPKGGIICLYGDLGTGKTVFVKGFAKKLGVEEKQVKSPTYTFVRSHKINNKILHHFDFYRIEKLDDLLINDMREILDTKNNWILIEWAERVEDILPESRINIYLKYIDESTREITIKDER